MLEMTLNNINEARALLARYDALAKDMAKKAELEREAQIKHGWATAEWEVTEEVLTIPGINGFLNGWTVRQINSFNGKTREANYYATYDGVLMSDSGGPRILQEGIILADEDFDLLNDGSVPKKLVRVDGYNPQYGY